MRPTIRFALKQVAAITVSLAINHSLAAQGINFEKIEILSQPIAPNLYALTGSPGVDPGHLEAAGGRIGVLVGPDGILVVDATYAPLTTKVLTAIRKLSPAPLRFLVNTHEHPDHTGGNPNFAKMGALIFAREEVRRDLIPAPPAPVQAAVGTAATWTDPDRLPVVTYGMGSAIQIHLDDEVVDLIPIRSAHTDGDTIVRFEHADVIMIGDFYRNYGYPFIDPAHGGTFKGVLEALDLLMKLARPSTQLVPGHGTIISRSDLEPYRNMILDIEAKVQQMIDVGKSKADVLAAKLTAQYDNKVPGGVTSLPAGFGTSSDRFVASVYDELKAAKGAR